MLMGSNVCEVQECLKNQASVVQTLDNTIHQISIREANCVIPWIDVYRVDSVIQRLNNQGRWNTP